MDQSKSPMFSEPLKNLMAQKPDKDARPSAVGRGTGSGPTKGDLDSLKFDIRPRELEDYLNKYVVNQTESISIIATKIATHYNRMKLELTEGFESPVLGNIKSNIIIIGPTGVGKTYIIKLIAHYIGVPFVKGDATKFSETGYVGGDVEDLIRELVSEANNDIARAQFGIVYLDEIDKIAGGRTGGPEVSRRGVQRNLLKLMEESDVELRANNDIAGQMEAVMQMQRTGKLDRKKINTRNILFIVSGAFDGMEDIVSKRLRKSGIGFSAPTQTSDVPETELLRHVSTEDLVKFGFESEFVGRLPVIAVLNPLDYDSMLSIVKNPTCSSIQSKILDFKSYGIDLTFADDALEYFAAEASKDSIGARGLTRIVENALLTFEKELPSSSVSSLHLTHSMIADPMGALRHLISGATLEDFASQFETNHGIRFIFENDAMDRITELAKEADMGQDQYCREIFKNYEYGLKLIGLSEFRVTLDVLKDPGGYLDSLIKQAYERRATAQED